VETVINDYISPENFSSVTDICAYIRARQPGKQQATHG
jgi:hypothetical protein